MQKSTKDQLSRLRVVPGYSLHKNKSLFPGLLSPCTCSNSSRHINLQLQPKASVLPHHSSPLAAVLGLKGYRAIEKNGIFFLRWCSFLHKMVFCSFHFWCWYYLFYLGNSTSRLRFFPEVLLLNHYFPASFESIQLYLGRHISQKLHLQIPVNNSRPYPVSGTNFCKK